MLLQYGSVLQCIASISESTQALSFSQLTERARVLKVSGTVAGCIICTNPVLRSFNSRVWSDTGKLIIAPSLGTLCHTCLGPSISVLALYRYKMGTAIPPVESQGKLEARQGGLPVHESYCTRTVYCA